MFRKPDELYFESDDLCFYFEGNDSRSFVDLDKYPRSASEFFKELEVMDCIPRVKKRKLDNERNVVFAKYPPYHKRGLCGFDPTIHVDGLEHAMNNPDLKKSAFIWNRIAKPHADCIKGDIEKATWKNYGNSGGPEPMTSEFGKLLINSFWLPKKSDGEMHRPCELTREDLPESFVWDENLAEQLGMRRDELAELAEKASIPVKVIEALKKPATLKRVQEFLARQDTVRTDSINPEFPQDPVKNPERRAAKIDEELENSPVKKYEVREKSDRVNAPREAARVWLKNAYTVDDQMFCQICGKEMPFKKRDGEYYFEAVEALDKEHLPLEHERQFLALCPECAARYQEFIKNDKGAMRKMIDRLMGSADGEIPLSLGELNPNLRFTKKHWFDFKEILKKSIGDTFPQ